MASMLRSKLRSTDRPQSVFETPWQPGRAALLLLRPPILPFPALPAPRPGCAVFVTASTLVHVALAARPDALRPLADSTNHAALLARVFASLVKEAPPLLVAPRGEDAAAARLARLDAEFGDAGVGVSCVGGGRTPERSVVVDAEGRVLRAGGSDWLLRQVSEGFVRKFADFLRVGAVGLFSERIEGAAHRAGRRAGDRRAALRGEGGARGGRAGLSGLLGERGLRRRAGERRAGEQPVGRAESAQRGAAAGSFGGRAARRVA